MTNLFGLPVPVDLSVAAARERLSPVLDHTQGIVLEKHRRDFNANLLLSFRSPDLDRVRRAIYPLPAPIEVPNAARLIAEGEAIHDHIDAEREAPALAPVAFVGLTYLGLGYLHVRERRFPRPFREGFPWRVEGKNFPANVADWHQPWVGCAIDAVVCVAASSASDLARAVSGMLEHWQGLASIHIEYGKVLCFPSPAPGIRGLAKEHFGFSDGTSQPVFFRSQDYDRRSWKSGYDPSATLQTVLVPEKLTFGLENSFGSYMAYLKIEQHVDRFEAALETLAATLDPPAGLSAKEYAGQLISGRAKNSAQLICPASHPNDFLRAQDESGRLWPHASHTCKMNPRDKPNSPPRMVRRGVPYDDGAGKGLLFQSFQSDLTQFEELFFAWSELSDQPKQDTGLDPLISRLPPIDARFPSTNPRPVRIGGLTTLRGGEYFYFPSIRALEKLSA